MARTTGKLLRYYALTSSFTGFLSGIFSGGGAKSIVMQISFVTLIFLLFLGPNFRGANYLRGAPPAPLWKKASFKRMINTEYWLRGTLKKNTQVCSPCILHAPFILSTSCNNQEILAFHYKEGRGAPPSPYGLLLFLKFSNNIRKNNGTKDN